MDLTCLLADLMDQQDRRKQHLLDSLQRLEAEQQVKQHDFWLLQYQQLLDVRPAERAPQALDPQLGWQLLTHGVIHLLPFLSQLLQTAGGKTGEQPIDDDGLLAAGVRAPADRVKVLRAVEAFRAGRQRTEEAEADDCAEVCARPTAEPMRSGPETAGPTAPPEAGGAECVVCLEQAVSIVEYF